MQSHKLRIDQPFELTSGEILPQLIIHYSTAGEYNATSNNCIWVIGPMTAHSNVFEWWKGLFGFQGLYSPHEHFIVSVDHLGSSYGTTGPNNLNEKGVPFFHDFPEISIHDLVQVNELVRNHLNVLKIETLIGASMGGQIALQWEVNQPAVAEHLVLVAANAKQSAWGIAFNESQRMAIENDSTWLKEEAESGQKGLETARAIALLGCRDRKVYQHEQDGLTLDKTQFKASNYQRYHGGKFGEQFNAISYHRLTKAMDKHDVGFAFGNIYKALNRVEAKTLVVGIRNDILFPEEEQILMAQGIMDADYQVLESDYGHDGSLLETSKLSLIMKDFYKGIEFQKMLNQLFQNAS